MAYKKAFVDSDIILDLFLKREPFVNYSRILLNDEIKEVHLFTSTLVLANVHYFVKKYTSKKMANLLIQNLSQILGVLPFEKRHVMEFIDNDYPDFEDGVQSCIAKQNACDLIITRNLRHYKGFDIPVVTAEQFLKEIL